jgi:mannose-6-phosphate isomerase-like protein (cupin superfamily)
MRPKLELISTVLSTAIAVTAVHWILDAVASSAAAARLTSKVVRWDEAQTSRDKWGEFRRFFDGEGYGANGLLAGMATVKPGEALHAAHRHAEEEFLFITEGSGTWILDGKEFPLKKGDVLYVAPWVVHGEVNTGKEPMSFAVARWAGKGVPVPPDPKAGTPLEEKR